MPALRRNALPIVVGVAAFLMATASVVVLANHWPWRAGTAFDNAFARGYDRRLFDVRDRSSRLLQSAPQRALGIGVQPAAGGVRVDAVVPDSPAAKAGVQVDDVITSINGEDTPSIAELRDLITKMTPGSQYELVVARGSEQLTLHVRAPSSAATPTPDGTKPGA